MTYCGYMPRYGSSKWGTWKNSLGLSVKPYLDSDAAWLYPFCEEPGPRDSESSYLSRLVMQRFLKNQGCETQFPQAIEGLERSPLNDVSLWIVGRPREELGFYFDIMNNPKPIHSLGLAWKQSKSEPRFKELYQTIGNFGLLPEWLRDGSRSLNFFHRDRGERWDVFMQYELLPRFKTSPHGHMGLLRYIELSCTYQYVFGCPPLEEGWRAPAFRWDSQIATWKRWLREQPRIRIASIFHCGKKVLPEEWDGEGDRAKELLVNEKERESVDDWICHLIEARGRCITSIANLP